jgi:hypothetical protein
MESHPVASATLAAAIRHLNEASKVLGAASAFLEEAASLLRQFFQVVGWLVVVVGCIKFSLDPHPSLSHLFVPGAGSLAVLQGRVKLRRRHEDIDATTAPAQAVSPETDPPSDIGTPQGGTPQDGEESGMGTAA